MHPEVSVIVTAYNRMEYLSQALESLLKQTEKKTTFEVVLITNFEYDLSRFLELKIRHIMMEGNVGSYLERGIRESQGEIICYLDDDDIFDINKIKIIIKAFKEDINYFHNRAFKFTNNNKLKSLNSNILEPDSKFQSMYNISQTKLNCRDNIEFNLSSIAIRKKILLPYLDYIKSLKQSTDTLNWFIFLETGGGVCRDERFLTYYRVHGSTSQKGRTGNNSLIKWYTEMVEFYENSQSKFRVPAIVELAKKRKSTFKGRLYLISNGNIKLSTEDKSTLFKNAIFPSKCTSGATGLLLSYLSLRLKKFLGMGSAEGVQ